MTNYNFLDSPNRKLAKLISNESFVRWIKGHASAYEEQRWEAWESEGPANRELRVNAEILYQIRLESDPADDVEAQLESINQRINRSEHKKNQILNRRMQSDYKIWGYRVTAAAAILLLMTSFALLFLDNTAESTDKTDDLVFKTVETGDEELRTLNFSDGSSIQLNSNTSFRYSLEQFKSEKVEVWLEGEGNFDIPTKHGGTKREFIVHTEDGKIQVLGTKFNVDTRFQKTSVVLEEGRVKVSGKDSRGIEAVGKILYPGEYAVIDKDKSDIVVQKVDVGLFTAWIDGVVEFEDTSLNDVISAIEVIYNVKIGVELPELLNRRVTGNIQNPDLQILLAGIQHILDLQIKQVANEEYLISQ